MRLDFIVFLISALLEYIPPKKQTFQTVRLFGIHPFRGHGQRADAPAWAMRPSARILKLMLRQSTDPQIEALLPPQAGWQTIDKEKKATAPDQAKAARAAPTPSPD